MITLVVAGRKPLLGTLTGSETNARVEWSALGKVIYEKELCKIEHFYPMVKVWKYCIMPDHIHLILNVSQDLPVGKTLGHVVRGFKSGCTRA